MLKTINKEINDFKVKSIEVVPGFTFNQYTTIQMIYRFYNSKYKNGEIDNDGDKKYFLNINRTPCNVATKAIDFDTKNIRLQTASGGSPIKTWFMERDLKFWMKDNNMGKTLNRIFHELPIFGTVVLKIIDNIPYFVDLRNFIVEQNADTLDQSNYIIEIHNYTPVEFKAIGNKKGWSNVDKALEEYRKMDNKAQYIKVYERHGEVLDNKEYIYKRVLYADVGTDNERDREITPHSGILLSAEKVKTHPYIEFHFEKMPGRWLGIGRVEILFDPQIRVNEISNQQVKSSHFSTLRLWQTKDEGMDRNLLRETENGEVLFIKQKLEQVDMADRNLAHYTNEIAKWMNNSDDITFSHDPMKGVRGPAGATLGATQIAAYQAGSYFEQIQENIALDVKEMLYNVIIPNFKKQNNQEHILLITGDDIDVLNRLIIAIKTNKEFLEYIERNNTIPSQKEYNILKTIVAENTNKAKEKPVSIPEKFYENIKYKIDIDIVGEGMDVRIKAANKWMALQAVASDPTLLSDPTKKKFFSSWLEDGGLRLLDFEPMTIQKPEEEQADIKPIGGGISRPTMAGAPISGQQTTNV